MKRLIEETLCEHGELDDHYVCGDVGYPEYNQMQHSPEKCLCPGGSSREVTVDIEAAALDIWNAVQGERPESWCRELALSSVDAALGGGL